MSEHLRYGRGFKAAREGALFGLIHASCCYSHLSSPWWPRFVFSALKLRHRIESASSTLTDVKCMCTCVLASLSRRKVFRWHQKDSSCELLKLWCWCASNTRYQMFGSRQASAGYPDKQRRLYLHEPDTSLRFSGEQKKTILCIYNWGGGKSKGRKVKWCIWAGFCQTIGDLEQKMRVVFEYNYRFIH